MMCALNPNLPFAFEGAPTPFRQTWQVCPPLTYRFLSQVRLPLFEKLNAEAHAHGKAKCAKDDVCGRCVILDGHGKVSTQLVTKAQIVFAKS